MDLTGVTNAQTVQVTLPGSGPTSAVVLMSVLLGDTNADRRVNVGDTNQTKSFSGQDTNQDNFRTDVNLDARVNVGDTNFVKSQSGNSLPPPPRRREDITRSSTR